MTRWLKAFSIDRRGATAIEYGLIALFIAVAIVASVTALGGTLQGMYQKIANIFTG